MLFTGSVPALAAAGETADSGGGTPTPTPGTSSETGWNPTNPCVSTGNIIADLRCLGAYIDPGFGCQQAPGEIHPPCGDDPPVYAASDYDVSFKTNAAGGVIGIYIFRKVPYNGSTEPDKMILKE